MTEQLKPVVTFETADEADKQALAFRAKYRGHNWNAFPHPDLLSKFAVALVTPAGRLAWHRA